MSLLDFLRPQGAQMPGAMSQPSGLSRLLQPEVALPMAAALMGNQGNMGNLSNAFGMAGPALQAQKADYEKKQKENQTLNWLKQNAPEFAAMAEGGAPMGEVWGAYMQQRFAQPKSPQVETFYNDQGQSYKAQWDGKGWVPVGGAKGEEGFEITTADGTTIRQGVLGNQDQKNVANRITAEQEGAAAATSLKQTVGMLRKANQNTGYSGPGAGVYGAIDDFGEQVGADILPGNSGSRATMRSGGLDVALAQVQKTKGAISNAEMGLFMAAAPGMQNTPQGNAALLDILDAVADRQLMRASEAETWRQTHGTLDGFENAWGQWVAQNPLLADNGQGGVSLAGGGAAPAGGQPAPRRKFNPATGRIE